MVRADSTMRVGERMQVAREDTCVRCGPGYALTARMIADQHMAANGFACQRVRSARPLPVGASRILDDVGHGFGGRRSRILDVEVVGSGVADLRVPTSRILDGAGHGYWVPKLRVVGSGICDGIGCLGTGGVRFCACVGVVPEVR